MRVCPKCSKRGGDESKICRNCGGILEEIPVAELAESDASHRPGASPVDEPQVTGQDGAAFSDDPDTTEWKCPQCGEMVPGTFDVCWKCYSASKAEGKPNHEKERDAAEQDAEDVGSGDEERLISKCSQCGSSEIMYGITVEDQGQHCDGQLRVVVFGDPQALIFKNRLHGRLQADICGQCGHVELRVANPRELYRRYRRSRL
jgi:hypothetical protein